MFNSISQWVHSEEVDNQFFSFIYLFLLYYICLGRGDSRGGGGGRGRGGGGGGFRGRGGGGGGRGGGGRFNREPEGPPESVVGKKKSIYNFFFCLLKNHFNI